MANLTLTREQVAAIAAGNVRLRGTDSQGYYVHNIELHGWERAAPLRGLLAEPVLVALAQCVERAEERADKWKAERDREQDAAVATYEQFEPLMAAKDARIAELLAQLHAIKEECPSSRLQDYLDATPLECVKKSIAWGIFQQSQRHLAAERVAELEAALRNAMSHLLVVGEKAETARDRIDAVLKGGA